MQGQIVGEYELREELGSGSFGTVWKARHRSADTWRAIKVAKGAALVEQFQREFEVLDRLDHPRIVRVHDLVTSGEAPAIIFEYVAGTDLGKLLQRQGRLPWQQAVQIALEVLEGLQVAHQAGLLHRDIKPPNILLTENGHVKIADFGLVSAAERSGSVEWSQQSASSQRAGTAHYMAPELDELRRAVPQSDLFSVGVMLYQCLTGRLPRGAFRPPSTCCDCPAWLDEPVMTLMARAVAVRPASARDAARGLRAPVEAPPPPEPPARVTLPRWHRRLLTRIQSQAPAAAHRMALSAVANMTRFAGKVACWSRRIWPITVASVSTLDKRTRAMLSSLVSQAAAASQMLRMRMAAHASQSSRWLAVGLALIILVAVIGLYGSAKHHQAERAEVERIAKQHAIARQRAEEEVKKAEAARHRMALERLRAHPVALNDYGVALRKPDWGHLGTRGRLGYPCKRFCISLKLDNALKGVEDQKGWWVVKMTGPSEAGHIGGKFTIKKDEADYRGSAWWTTGWASFAKGKYYYYIKVNGEIMATDTFSIP